MRAASVQWFDIKSADKNPGGLWSERLFIIVITLGLFTKGWMHIESLYTLICKCRFGKLLNMATIP